MFYHHNIYSAVPTKIFLTININKYECLCSYSITETKLQKDCLSVIVCSID